MRLEAHIRRVLTVPQECAPRAALIPLHDRELRFVARELGGERGERDAWAAVDVQKQRVTAIGTADRDPLLDAT